MPLKGEAKKRWDKEYNKRQGEPRRRLWRSIRRTRVYGNWRQLYFDQCGMCQTCGTADSLDVHEVPDGYDGLVVKEYRLLCYTCHVEKEHGYGWVRRKHKSRLTEDVQAELVACGSIEAWMITYGIIAKRQDVLQFWQAFVPVLIEDAERVKEATIEGDVHDTHSDNVGT